MKLTKQERWDLRTALSLAIESEEIATQAHRNSYTGKLMCGYAGVDRAIRARIGRMQRLRTKLEREP